MDKLPAAVWALMLALMGAVLAVLVLFHNAGEQTTNQAVLTIASSLVSGALGAFAGHAAGSTKADVTTGNSPVTINQSDSK